MAAGRALIGLKNRLRDPFHRPGWKGSLMIHRSAMVPGILVVANREGLDETGGYIVKAVLQRVSHAEVSVGMKVIAEVGAGLVVLLGVEVGDGPEEIDFMVHKISRMRVFADDAGKMNLSVADVGGSVLVVSQFTLCADVARGHRPSFSGAAESALAKPLFERFCSDLRGRDLTVETGEFAATMVVRLVNDGPVTIWLETPRRVGGGS